MKHEKSKLFVQGFHLKFNSLTLSWIVLINSIPATGLLVWMLISKFTKVSCISVRSLFSKVTLVASICGIMWRIKVFTGGHLFSFFTSSMLVSMECHSPGPIFKIARLGHWTWSVSKLGMFNITSFNAPSHFPSSPNAMQGISRNNLFKNQFPFTSFESARKFDAP